MHNGFDIVAYVHHRAVVEEIAQNILMVLDPTNRPHQLNSYDGKYYSRKV